MKKEKVIGILIVVVVVLFVAAFFILRNVGETAKTEEEIPVVTEESKEENQGTDVTPGSEEEKRKTMGLTIEMPKEMEKRIIHRKLLQSSMEDYLIKNGFWTDVHHVESYELSEDYRNNLLLMTFDMDNRARDHLTVIYYIDEDRYEYNYY